MNLYMPGTKTSVLYSSDLHAGFLEDKDFGMREPPRLLKPRFLLESIVFAFEPFHVLFDVFDRKLQQYVEADFVNYNIRQWEDSNNRKMYKHKETFAILTLGELEAGFVVSMVPFVISILVFGIEWIPTLKDLVTVLFVFKCLFKVKDLEQTNHSAVIKIRFEAWQKSNQEKQRLENAKTVEKDTRQPKKFYLLNV